MSIVVVSSDQINTAIGGEATGNSGSQLVTLSTGDELYVAEDVFMAADGSLVDVGNIDFIDVIYNGDGFSGSNAFRFDRSSSQPDFDFEHSLTIGSDATITTLSSLGFFGVLASSLSLLDDNSEFDFYNAGTATSTDGRGFEFQSITFVRATNVGEIHSGVGPTMVFENNVRANFANAGTLTNGRDFVTGIVDHLEATVGFNNTVQNMTMVNSGTIIGNIASVFSSANTSESLQNTGTIAGDMYMSNSVGGTLENAGTITGDIYTLGGDDSVTNTGTITGDVELEDDNDFFSNAGGGIVSGFIDGGSGDDTIFGGNNDDAIVAGDDNDLVAGAAGDDGISGGEGNDTIFGGEGDDTIEGDAGNEDIFGGSGADSITGGKGTDNLRGNSGSDYIDGGDELDLLRGGDGNDTLIGGEGNDTLNGGAGNDELTAGIGKDVMRGNRGEDVFIFSDALDSTTSAVDRIRDFQIGQDLIDLSAIDTFTFIGSAAFSGTGAEVRFQTTGSGLRFDVDVDGNGSADMRVNMNNISVLTTEDFIL